MEISDFPRILTQLRKEKGISQKKAATELGVSQSLLSHYEKGVRECGLIFLVRAADYYGVTIDYILGRSYEKDGKKIAVEELPEDLQSKGNTGIKSMIPTLNKKLINNSVSILMDTLAKIDNKDLTNDVSSYISLAVYRMFRMIYNANESNPQDVFGADKKEFHFMLDATMNSNLISIYKKLIDADSANLDFHTIKEQYPELSPSLLNLLQNCENKIGARKK